MAFEVEILAVRNADAILLRYFNTDEEEFVVLIDVGHRGQGAAITEHIIKYTLKKEIDLAVCSHPDDDHICGFFHIVGKIPIKKFWIHNPVDHKLDLGLIKEAAQENWFEKGLKNVLESLKDSTSLLQLIDAEKIEREEPFAGLIHPDIPITVVGPSVTYYEEKLDHFRDRDLLYLEETNMEISKGNESLPLLSQILEEMSLNDRELLDKKNDRSNENNSSVIMLFEADGKRVLFTGDAGPEALQLAHNDYDLSDIDLLDIPHHGSRYNITSDLIDIFDPDYAVISCAPAGKYPSLQFLNVLKEKGCKVYATNDNRAIIYKTGVRTRDGYGSETPL